MPNIEYKINTIKFNKSFNGMDDVAVSLDLQVVVFDSLGSSHKEVITIALPEPNPSQFTPVSNLTQDGVLNWAKSLFLKNKTEEQVIADFVKIIDDNRNSYFAIPWE